MQSGKADQTDLPDPKIIALMLARCACNNHTICDDELRPIGQQLSLTMVSYSAGNVLTSICSRHVPLSFSHHHILVCGA